jgi:hypothetical protein
VAAAKRNRLDAPDGGMTWVVADAEQVVHAGEARPQSFTGYARAWRRALADQSATTGLRPTATARLPDGRVDHLLCFMRDRRASR